MPTGLRRYLPVVALVVAALPAWLVWPARRPSVLLISIDAMRPDYLSCYGGRHAPTPHIDALAAAGMTFTQAVAHEPWDRASMASVLTGRYAAAHRVRSVFDRLPTTITMATAFAAAGYRTAAVVSDFDLDHIFGLDQGFQAYDDRYTSTRWRPRHAPPVHRASIFYADPGQDRSFRRVKLPADSIRNDAEVTDSAIAWLRRVGARPFFLWVHYFGPYPGADADARLAEYQHAVQRADAQVGRLLEWLDARQLDRNTIIVLHASRGTSLGERGASVPGGELYDSSLRVPLIIYWNGRIPAGKRYGGMVRLIDLFPTLADLAGVAPPANLDGRSLAGVLRGREDQQITEAYCETYLPATADFARSYAPPMAPPCTLVSCAAVSGRRGGSSSAAPRAL